MGKIKTLGLRQGTRVGNYEIEGPIGRGWEGEVYAVREIPTEAPRAMKIVRHRRGESIRDRIHTAWYFEQLAHTGSVARYYHMGQWFFGDDEGVSYFVFERLPGIDLAAWLRRNRPRITSQRATALTLKIAECVSRVHDAGFAVGDFESGENIIVLGDVESVKICDCNPGVADRPNVDYRNDIKELRALALRIFGARARSSVFRVLDATIRRHVRRPNSRRSMGAVVRALRGLGPS